MNSSAQLMKRIRSSFTTDSASSSASFSPPSPPSPPSQTTQTTTASSNTTQGKLEVLDQVLSEIEQAALSADSVGAGNVAGASNMAVTNNVASAGALAQAVPQVTLDQTDTLNPTQPTVSLKEAETNISPDIGLVESGAGLQQVEYEKSAELSPEVESFLQKVEEKPDVNLDEIVIADGTATPSAANPPVKKPVIVLPITPQEEKRGERKPLKESFRWLVEWSKKIMKMFAGEVIYRHEGDSA